MLLLLFCVFGLGSFVIQLIGYHNRMQLNYYVYSIALGTGILAHFILAIGAGGILYQKTVWGFIFIGIIIGFLELFVNRQNYHEVILRAKNIKIDWFSWALLLLLFTSLIYPLIANALVPSTFFDEVAYHLAIPQTYIQNHGIMYIPFILQSNWPLESELLLIPGLIISSENLAHLVTWIFAIVISLSLFMYMHKLFSGKAGLIAALIFASTPMTLKLSGMAMVEIPLSLYALLATMTMIEWLLEDDPKGWLLSALFGGLAASTKLNGASIPIILGFFMFVVLLIKDKKPLRVAIGRFILYGIIALIIVLPWYTKSWVQTGNPIWPFLFNFLDGRNWDTQASENLMWFLKLPNMHINLKNWFLGIYNLTIDDGKFGSFYLGWHYIILLPLAVPAIFFQKGIKQRRFILWLFFLGLIYYTVWFFQTHQTRFLMPAVTVFALLAAAGIYWISQCISSRWGIVIQILLLLLFGTTHWLVLPSSRSQFVTNLPYLTGKINRDQYLQEKIQGYQVFLYANENLPPDSHIWLGLWESRGYYLEHRYTWMNPISQREIKIEEYDDAEDLVTELKSRGITHIMLSTIYMEDFIDRPYMNDISNIIRQVVNDYGKLIYTTKPIDLYEITN